MQNKYEKILLYFNLKKLTNYNLIYISLFNQLQMDPVRDNFLRSLSNYSECIKPYLRQVQEKYVAAYYIVESDKVDLNAYCQKERE